MRPSTIPRVGSSIPGCLSGQRGRLSFAALRSGRATSISGASPASAAIDDLSASARISVSYLADATFNSLTCDRVARERRIEAAAVSTASSRSIHFRVMAQFF